MYAQITSVNHSFCTIFNFDYSQRVNGTLVYAQRIITILCYMFKMPAFEIEHEQCPWP
jgi:hypothetical protein